MMIPGVWCDAPKGGRELTHDRLCFWVGAVGQFGKLPYGDCHSERSLRSEESLPLLPHNRLISPALLGFLGGPRNDTIGRS